MKKIKVVASNRDARFSYEILETEVVGIMLMGSELKPLRAGKAGINESYIWIDIEKNSVYIKNMYIKNEMNNAYSHEEFRVRKLLMTKKQITKWFEQASIKGVSIIPLQAYFDEKNRLKLEIALGKGKKMYDKRNSIRDQDVKRDTERELNSK